MLQTLIDGQKAIRNDLADVIKRLDETDKNIESLTDRMSQVEKEIKEVTKKTNAMASSNVNLGEIQETMRVHQKKLVELEDRSRRSNLVVFGIKETKDETPETLRQKVIKEIIEDKLGVCCSSVARIHRLGKASSNRPVILYFQNYLEKQEVLRKSGKLKGSRIFLQNDFSVETRRKRKNLWQSAKTDKENGKKVSLVNDRLRIDNSFYVWSDASNGRVLLKQMADVQDDR